MPAPFAKECPCHSGSKYTACCMPFHKGELEAPTPEALMRSRYSAFARGLPDYLKKTLAPNHPDLKEPMPKPHEMTRLRYLGLKILSSSVEDEANRGEVLFAARIFDKGLDRSFTELSRFVRVDVEGKPAWRYQSGDSIPAGKMPKTSPEAAPITRDAFVEHFAKVGQIDHFII